MKVIFTQNYRFNFVVNNFAIYFLWKAEILIFEVIAFWGLRNLESLGIKLDTKTCPQVGFQRILDMLLYKKIAFY